MRVFHQGNVVFSHRPDLQEDTHAMQLNAEIAMTIRFRMRRTRAGAVNDLKHAATPTWNIP